MTKQIKKLSLALLALLATIVFVLGAVSFKSPVSGAADALADAQIYGLDFADADNRGKNTVGDLADATIVSDGITYTEDAINGKNAINLPGTGVRTNYISIDKEVLNNDVVTFAGWFKLPSNGNTWSRPINVFVDGSNRVEVMPITDASQNTVLNISFIVNGVAYSNQGYDSTLYNVQSESAWGASYKYPTYNLQSYFNTWAHYAYTFTPETISYYVNGELCASVKTTDMSHRTADNMSFSLKQFYGENAKVAIGATFTDSTKDYKGSIADLRIYNKALTEEELVSISGVDKLTYKDKLISLYNFESGTKDSIRAFDGSLVNSAKVEYNSKIGSNVLALDGAGTSKNASMMTVDSKALHGLKEFTISLDVNILNNVGGYARIFDYAPNVAQQLVLAVKWNNTNVMKAKYTNNETVADKKHEVNYDFSLYGAWKNVALTVDGETAKIYIDGKLVSSGAFPYNPNVFSNSIATKLTFGGTYYSSDAGTPCYMDNIKIYSCALTADEIATEYATENPVPEQEWFVTPLSDVKLAEGSWLEELTQTNIDYMMSMDRDRMLYNHRMVAGLDTKGATSYQGWEAPNRGLSGQYASNYLAGLVRAAAHMGDYEYNGETVLERLDYLLKEFQKCQEAYAVLDPANAGYFGGLCMDQFNAYVGKGPYIWAPSASGTYTTVLEGQTGAARGYGSYLKTTFPNGSQEIVFIWVPWRVNHDNLKALYDVYMYAPTAELKEIGKEMMFAHADWCYNTIYGYTAAQRSRLPSIEYGGMAEALYNISYEAKKLGLNDKAANYAWAGQYFMEGNLISDWYNNVDNLSSGSHNNLKGKHANTTIPKIFACMAAFEATSDEYYFTAAVNAFDMLMTRIYAMGGTSLYENWQHDPYCLQTGSSTCETCCTLNMLKLADYLFKWTGDKKYADFYEFAFTNHTLSSMDPDTGFKTYFVGTAFGDHKVYHTYDQSFWCCTSTGLESFAKLNYAIYYKSLDASAVSVNMFYPSVYTHSDDITIIQSGNLNQDQKTVFTIDGAGALTLRLRNPDWTKGASFKLNGEDFTDFTLKDGYYEISRTWVDGDKLEYNLPFKFYTVKLNNSSNFASIMYGPLTLVADLGNEGFNDIRQGQTEYPSAYTGAIKNKLAVLGGDFEANSTVEFDADGKMTVKINTLNQGVLTFKPFNEVFHSRYGMYFDMIDTSDLEDKYIVDGNTYVNTFDVENDVASNKLTSGNVTVAGGVLTTSETENSGYLTNGASKVLTKFEVKPATTQNGPIDIALIVLAKSNGTIDSITGYAVMVKKPAYDYGITLTINKIVNGEVGDAIVTKKFNYNYNLGLKLYVVSSTEGIYVYFTGEFEVLTSIEVDSSFVTSDMTDIGLIAYKTKVKFDNFEVTYADADDKIMLKNAIAFLTNADEDKYTLNSWNAISDTIEGIPADISGLTKKEADELNATLRQAIATLKLRGDTTALLEKVNTYKAIDQSKYTSISCKTLNKAISEFEACTDLANLSVEDVDDFIKELDKGYGKLVERADMTELNEVIAQYEALNKDDYVAREWNELETIAEAVIALNGDMDQSKADIYTDRIKDAIAALVLKEVDPIQPEQPPVNPENPDNGGDKGGCKSVVSAVSGLGFVGVSALLGATYIGVRKAKRKED